MRGPTESTSSIIAAGCQYQQAYTLLSLWLKSVLTATAGIIVGGAGAAGSTGSVITAGALIKQLQSLAKNKAVAAVVLRIDSGGGDALASDLMWREIKKLSDMKPVVASMGDVAASGGSVLLPSVAYTFSSFTEPVLMTFMAASCHLMWTQTINDAVLHLHQAAGLVCVLLSSESMLFVPSFVTTGCCIAASVAAQ